MDGILNWSVVFLSSQPFKKGYNSQYAVKRKKMEGTRKNTFCEYSYPKPTKEGGDNNLYTVSHFS